MILWHDGHAFITFGVYYVANTTIETVYTVILSHVLSWPIKAQAEDYPSGLNRPQALKSYLQDQIVC